MKEVLLGHCGVDSGQLYIVDPCYVYEGFSYDAVCSSHTVGTYGGPVGREGVVTSTGWGDGVYPVYAEIDEKTDRVSRVIIDFGLTGKWEDGYEEDEEDEDED